MQVTKNEHTIFCDVDGTLIIPDNLRNSLCKQVLVFDKVENKFISLRQHEPNIRLLKEEKHRGSYIVVWSRGGHEWAESVVLALGLQDCVDQIMTKPLVYIDDVSVQEWLPYRVFLDSNMPYKK